MWLVPAGALAHGANGHRADPNLHVDAALEDCSVQFSPELSQGAFRRFAREFGSFSAFNDDLDLGVFYTEQPKANYGWIGLEAKYALMQQSETAPISLALPCSA